MVPDLGVSRDLGESGSSMISDQYGQGLWLEDPSPLELTLDGDVLNNGTALLPGNYLRYVRSWVAGGDFGVVFRNEFHGGGGE
ncbi:MAG: hypothetical protein P1U81_15305 [Verrucomicrobiales bacterium]|jgi:hypothetical protein|nr:hypothetical protein [Verrucomicrobiales bacterium]